ncbi:hypothetical protein R1sor_027275 [Riccia sorocarpa]|uniref:Uncharacterized protein n=1 Tax=Riccia sorocarpa TaxID=122646 RepID=A0ABD3GDQ6_9MARC
MEFTSVREHQETFESAETPGWPVLSGAAVGKRIASRPNVDPPTLCTLGVPADERVSILDSQVDISMEGVVEIQPIDFSCLEDEIQEVEDNPPYEGNEGDVSESVAEELPTSGRSEHLPISTGVKRRHHPLRDSCRDDPRPPPPPPSFCK